MYILPSMVRAPAMTFHCMSASLYMDPSCPPVLAWSGLLILFFMSVGSGSVSWAASIADRRSLNGLMVVVAKFAKSRAVGLLWPSS